ncbi:hypothetical protein IW147_000900 [Coemansia sp. RSA 720]|nr:hypothetical protein IW147_000900 [Coemansia sp. RSA 720]KAJ2666797.1 hypothetical protein IW148_000522 [Coemansia sp. RSA 1199]
MRNGRRLSAGAIAKDHHLSRNGAQLSHPDKKGGAGKYNWGDDMSQLEELEKDLPLVSQSKVRIASPKEFNSAK